MYFIFIGIRSARMFEVHEIRSARMFEVHEIRSARMFLQSLVA